MAWLLLVCLLQLQACCDAISYFEVVAQEWETWKSMHAKNYSSSTEDKFRMKIYMENKAKIDRHNDLASRGDHSYFLKMNNYGDLLHHEFVTLMNAPNLQGHANLTGDHMPVTWMAPVNVQLPESMDWRVWGAVTPVKNQGQCGSCWAFSSTGSLETQHFRKTGTLVSLSEQNLVDCSRSFGNQGCGGGWMDNAFRYIKAYGGINSERDYPYVGYEGSCRFNPNAVATTLATYVHLPRGSEDQLKTALGTIGTVSVAVDASHQTFQFYSHGVYDEPRCNPNALSHAVLAVGYGTENGKDYWLVKNSWATWWGDQGYIKMSRNKNNQCGIASMASYPLL